MKTSRFSRLLAAICIPLLLAACQTAAPVSKTASPTPGTLPSVTPLRVADSGGAGMTLALELIIERWQHAHPDRPVELVKVPIGTKGLAEAALEMEQIDIIPNTGYGWSEQKLLDLKPYAITGRFDESIYGMLLGDREQPGKLHAVPLLVRPFLLACNVDGFAAAGVPFPEDGWTWDEFREVLAKLKAAHGKPVLEAQFSDALVQAYVEQQTRRPMWEAEEKDVAHALAYFDTLVNVDHSIEPSPSTEKPITIDHAGFIRGDTLISLQEYFAGSTTVYGFRWRYVPIPAFDPTYRVTFAWAEWLGVARQSANPEAAWEFMKFAASDEMAVAIASAGLMPARMTDAVRDTAMASASTDSKLAALTSMRFTVMPGNANRARFARPVLYAGNRVLSQRLSIDEALEKYRTERAEAVARKQ